MKLVAKDKNEARLFLTWICLNSVDFWGNEDSVKEYKALLRKYRKSVATALGVPPIDVQSEMLDLYEGNEQICKKLQTA